MIHRASAPLLALFALLAIPHAAAQSAASASQAAQQEANAEQASLADLLQRGRDLLHRRQPAQALPYLERAAAMAPDDFEARLWQLRAWMDLGRSNDTLDAIDELRRAGRSGPAMEYLYGMAFLRRAQKLLSEGVTDSSPRMNFEDAAFRLEKTLKADPERFPDAYQGLAVAAWYNTSLEVARWAGEGAVQRFPWSARAHLQLGRIAMSQFSGSRSADGEDGWSEETRAHHERALSAFQRAIEVLGEPVEDAQGQRLLSDAGIQLGHALIWEGRQAEAKDAYAIGIGWSPEAVDYRQLMSLLTPGGDARPRPSLFHAALEEGAARFQANFGPDDLRDTNLLWWLGWERLQAGHAVGSELAFLGSVQKNPGYVNSWFYVALARFQAHNFAGGADALEAGWAVDSNVIIDTLMTDKAKHLWILGRALSQLNKSKRFLTSDDNRRAAMLSRVIAEADPYDGWNWNNLGMFVRDHADTLIWAGKQATGDPVVNALYEKSYGAYQRSIELLPDDPGIVNDTAVLLHYYLKRDQEKALDMYARATVLARAALEDEELSKTERERLEIALRDSIENRRLLLEELGLPADPVEEPAADPKAPAQPEEPQAATAAATSDDLR